MPKYLFKGRYTSEGLGGLMKDGGSARRAAVDALVRGAGGTMEAFYFAFGEDDVYAICDLPDHTSAARLALTVSSGGRASAVTVPLLTVEEIDGISQQERLTYTPPGS